MTNFYFVLKEYLMCSKKLYGADLQTVDFQMHLEAAILKINAWVENKTQGKTKQNQKLCYQHLCRESKLHS